MPAQHNSLGTPGRQTNPRFVRRRTRLTPSIHPSRHLASSPPPSHNTSTAQPHAPSTHTDLTFTPPRHLRVADTPQRLPRPRFPIRTPVVAHIRPPPSLLFATRPSAAQTSHRHRTQPHGYSPTNAPPDHPTIRPAGRPCDVVVPGPGCHSLPIAVSQGCSASLLCSAWGSGDCVRRSLRLVGGRAVAPEWR